MEIWHWERKAPGAETTPPLGKSEHPKNRQTQKMRLRKSEKNRKSRKQQEKTKCKNPRIRRKTRRNKKTTKRTEALKVACSGKWSEGSWALGKGPSADAGAGSCWPRIRGAKWLFVRVLYPMRPGQQLKEPLKVATRGNWSLLLTLKKWLAKSPLFFSITGS